MPKKPAKSVNRAKAEDAVEALSKVISSGVDEALLNDMPCMMIPEVASTLGLLYPDGVPEGQAAMVKGTFAYRVASDAVKLTSYMGVVDLVDVSILLSAPVLPRVFGGRLGQDVSTPEMLSTVEQATARDNLRLSVEWAKTAQRYLYDCRVKGFAGKEVPPFPVDKEITRKDYGDGAFEVRDYHHAVGVDIRDAVTDLFDRMGSDFSKRVIDCVARYVKGKGKE